MIQYQVAINSYPALFALSDTKFGKQLDLIVVGAANDGGESLSISQGGENLDVYAVGSLVNCPYFKGTSDINKGLTGTSCGMSTLSFVLLHSFSPFEPEN